MPYVESEGSEQYSLIKAQITGCLVNVVIRAATAGMWHKFFRGCDEARPTPRRYGGTSLTDAEFVPFDFHARFMLE